MAAGSAGDTAIPAVGDEEVLNMRTTIENMNRSISEFQSQMAELLEYPTRFFAREPSGHDKGPAVRASEYNHGLD